MLKEVKKIWDSIPQAVKVLLFLAILYKLYQWVKDQADKAKRNKDNGQYADAGGAPVAGNVNLRVQADKVWGAFYDSWYENEEAAIAAINAIHVSRMTEFNAIYNELLDKKKKPIWVFTYGPNLVADCKRLLSASQFKQVETNLNYI